MGRNKRVPSPLAMVIRIVNAIITVIGYCVVIKGFCNGSLIIDLIYYLNGVIELFNIITKGT